MSKKTKAGNEREAEDVKKETVLILICIALAVGFLVGVVYSSFKLGGDAPGRAPAPPPRTVVRDQDASPELEEKIKLLEQETLSNPEDAKAWAQLGNVYFDTAKPQKAIMAYKKALELRPDDANVLTDMGIMYRRSGQPDKAVEAFDRAMEIDPRHEASRFNKGIVLMHDLKNPQGAIKAWEGLLKLNPSATASNGQPIKELIEKLKQNMNR